MLDLFTLTFASCGFRSLPIPNGGASLVIQMVKNLPAMQETQV